MKSKHLPCSCGCGEMADECMSGRNPLGAFDVSPAPTCPKCKGWGSIETGRRVTGERVLIARTCRACNGSGRS